jgi:subtilisin family serine protease
MQMRLRLSVLVALIIGLILVIPTHVTTQSARDARVLDYVNGLPVVDGEVLVRFRTGTPGERATINALIDADDDQPVGSGVWHRIHSASRTVQLLLTALRGRGEILDIEPNYIVQTTDTLPNDPSIPWGLRNPGPPGVPGGVPGADIHASQAWDITTGSTSNVVGVVDTGVDYTHPDLAGNVWTAPTPFTVKVAGTTITCPAGSHGFNAIAFTCDPMDDNGHGTHTSGTIGAVGNNRTGVVGVNWTTRIMGLKFLDSTGSGLISDAINAIDFAIQTKGFFGTLANVRVLSNSWGSPGATPSSLASEIDKAITADMLFVAAAGNSGSNNDAAPFYPASYKPAGTIPDNVVAVAATTESDGLASFSNYGAKSVDLGAPGTNIYSTYLGGGYTTLNGTSMATPHVSGAAMLVLSACSLSTTQLKAALLSNVYPSLSGMVVSNGRLDVNAAVRSCAALPTVSMTSPADGATFTAPASVTLSATAASANGISRVEFYQGTTLIGTSTSAPFGGTWTSVSSGVYALTAKAYDASGVSNRSAPVYVTVTNPGVPINVALASNSATAVASSTYGPGFDPSGAINGDRKGALWGNGGGWNDGTANAWPDWLEVDFAGTHTISEVDVFSVQDNYTAPVDPTPTMTFTQYGVTDFTVQYWDGTTWQTVPGGAIGGNNLVWRQLTFAPVTTAKIRLLVTGALNTWSRVTELEAYQSSPGTAPPTVSLTAPTDGATYSTAPATIAMSATASGSKGAGINHVEFYQGSTLLNSTATSPYQFSWTNVPAGSYILTAKAYDTLGASSTSTPVHVTVSTGGTTAGGGRTNVALASSGATAVASSTYSSGYDASGAINGDRKGASWGNGGGWNDATPNAWPDWLEVDFAGTKTINEVDVFSVQDNFTAPVDPTPTMTFTQYGLTDFTVQYWDGAVWQTVPGGVISSNNLVWRQVTFAAVTTAKIRLLVTGALNTWSRVTELEAYAAPTNVALASNGATALASSTYSSGYGASGAINGDRKGASWGSGGGWNDGTPNAWPDWLEVDFAGTKTISEVDVFSVQDNYTAPVDPTPTMTFTQYGLTDFTVQYWDGTTWVTPPGGAVSGNNLVWRQVSFAAVTTTKIRLLVTGALATWSRVTELEAYGP